MIRTWLYRWLFNRRRNIFKLWNGRKWTKIDPLPAFRTFIGSNEIDFPGDVDQMQTTMDMGTQMELFGKVMPIAHCAFCTEPFNGTSGLTELEMQQLIERFFLYMLELKKNTAVKPT